MNPRVDRCPDPAFFALASAVGAAAVCALLAAPRDARAQVIQRFALRVEAGAGTVFTNYQRDVLGYDGAIFQGTARLAVTPIEPLAVQLSVANWFFPAGEREMGRLLAFQGGLRLEPRTGRVGRFVLDFNAGVGLTGALRRFTFDAGIGYEFALGSAVGLGPVFRYAHVVQDRADQVAPQDAMFWSAGLSLSLRVPEASRAAAPRPSDADGDGVLDGADLCPHEPAGMRPDPSHWGCPARDTDRDGVYDPEDRCPTEPVGLHPDPARRGCPTLDSDGDGVRDPQDLCPQEHAGPEPDPARAGCPAPDRDHDTVVDPRDHCPDEPGAPHPDPMRNGCPGVVSISQGQIRISQQVFFATNRDTILPRSYPVLQAVADAMTASPQLHRVSVEGHTDDVGDDARNQDLSDRRARSVAAWLVRAGIDPARLTAQGFGESRPLESNRTAAGRARNRRVEFHIVEQP